MIYGKSIFPVMPKDTNAYVFTTEEFGADPAGKGDNTAAMQAVIDKLEGEVKNGIVFVPEGTYRFEGTVELWRGIRLIGFGENRPVFTVADNTPGFQGPDSKYIFHFRVNKPGIGQELRDAQNTTFYNGIRNIDFKLGKGNPGLVACRFRVAQLCSIEDVDFYMEDNRAAVMKWNAADSLEDNSVYLPVKPYHTGRSTLEIAFLPDRLGHVFLPTAQV